MIFKETGHNAFPTTDYCLLSVEHHVSHTLSQDDSQAMFDIIKKITENKWNDISQRIFYHGKALEFLSMIV